MSKQINPVALFRLSVLGPLVSREKFERGEQQRIIGELASRDYAIPNSNRHRIGEKTLESWLRLFRRDGIEALTPKTRADSGRSKIAPAIQEAIVAAKKDNPCRSVRRIRQLLEDDGQVARNCLSRSAIHRLLKEHGISGMRGPAAEPEEKRSFVAETAGAIWYGDVMHGPRLMLGGRMRKTYLVSLLDDASRLVAHSAFCLGETALDIEGVLKQALLKRGRPVKLVVDNGAAYVAGSLQGVCARLGMHLIHCRPYQATSKGKIERWHRTMRDQFLSELDVDRIADLPDLNARLWAWLEEIYHKTPHGGLGGMTPLARYQKDLDKVRSLGQFAPHLDALFHHRIKRHVRRDGTVSYLNARFEVPYELAGKSVKLVVDPQAGVVIGVEDDKGASLGQATPLDLIANASRKRRQPQEEAIQAGPRSGPNQVEQAHRKYHGKKEA
ncbi:integrase [Flavobacterium cupreum]|uniref:Integrase n=1 Tax=Flavobacterium cupreum TaxID=2133766 RepID=A0A434A024_9FLAO|nr:DDE-type integrase/transposase/recombinase [Flavobacterium cupreum]RUT67711.1 integrase [Flavobacterium cupreum]